METNRIKIHVVKEMIILEYEDFQKVHNEIGMMLAKLSGARDVRQVRAYQDALNAKLVAGKVKSLDDLYDAILAAIK